MIDLEQAFYLLSLIEKLAGHPNKYTNIRAAALAQLDEINNPPPSMEEPQADPEPEPEVPPPNPEPETTNRRV